MNHKQQLEALGHLAFAVVDLQSAVNQLTQKIDSLIKGEQPPYHDAVKGLVQSLKEKKKNGTS